MTQEEIFQLIIEERKKQGFLREELDEKAGTVVFGTILEITNNKKKSYSSVMFSNLVKLLDALGFEVIIEDKNANWGLDMRLRRLPKKLFTGQRIEMREHIRTKGLDARVDLFDSPEAVLKFVPKPCDVYEVLPGALIRKHIDMNDDHPFGTMYSYNEHISPDHIENRVTYR